MKTKFLNIVANSAVTVKSQKHLNDYLDLCLKNNQNKKIPGITEHHHILPRALFLDYRNLKENEWNGTHLTFEDHYKAHALLIDALDNEKIILGWSAMNFKFKYNEQCEIIGSKKYKELREKHREIVIDYNKNRTITDKTRKKNGRKQ